MNCRNTPRLLYSSELLSLGYSVSMHYKQEKIRFIEPRRLIYPTISGPSCRITIQTQSRRMERVQLKELLVPFPGLFLRSGQSTLLIVIDQPF